jgi:uncharacterized OB-fold protein
MASNAATAARRVPIREGLLTAPLSELDAVRLVGSRCATCAETTLGRNSICPNCGGEAVSELPLSRRGRLWTYTVVRHRPPGNYQGGEPFEPFALGLVELPDGVRVLAPIEGDCTRLKIGMELEFRAFVRAAGAVPEVVSFAFASVS